MGVLIVATTTALGPRWSRLTGASPTIRELKLPAPCASVRCVPPRAELSHLPTVENDQTAKIGRQRPPVLPSQVIVTKHQTSHGKIIALTTEVAALRDHLLRLVAHGDGEDRGRGVDPKFRRWIQPAAGEQ